MSTTTPNSRLATGVGTVYINRQCPACAPVMSYMQQADSKTREAFHLSNVQFENKPPSVTQVPTLMLRSGETLVGDEVYRYIKQWRKDVNPPHTKHFELWENFGFQNGNMLTLPNLLKILVILFVLYVIYHYFWRQSQTSPAGTYLI